MTILDDMTSAILTYPETDVELEVIDVDIPGDVLNTNEEARFRVRVTNRGPLTMTDVRLKCVAENGALVKSQSALSQFGPEVLDAGIIDRIAAHGGTGEGNLFILKAPPTIKPRGTRLCSITLEEWDAGFDHMLNSHSRASATPSVSVESRVAGS